MTPGAVAIRSVGLVSSLGLSASATCAALRAGISGASIPGSITAEAKPLPVHRVPLERPWSGRGRLRKMLTTALRECLEALHSEEKRGLPLLLCVAERERTGRIEGLDDRLFGELEEDLGLTCDHQRSGVLPLGRAGPLAALAEARRLIRDQGIAHVVVAAADSLLQHATISDMQRHGRLLSESNSNGFIPGEAAGAMLLTAATSKHDELVCLGLGAGLESASLMSGQPLRAEGLTLAIRAALNDACLQMHDVDFRITDVSGEQYFFKEASLAAGRLLRQRKEHFDLWHPAEGIGEVGAAASIAMMAVALIACRKGYALGPHILLHVSCDGPRRAAAILNYSTAR